MKRKYMLSFPECTGSQPVIHDLIKRFDICINIIKAEIAPGMDASMLAEFTAPEEDMARTVEFLGNLGVGTALVTDKIIFREERCIACGNCALACFPKALTIGPPDWKLSLRKENCILCKLCLTACPQKLFTITTD
ncbi:MAG TPA: 4Fe-4S binding protein [Candidatus Tidjanibacter gallistercoris]|nr:4Fe-4S binding protein [Candidatus Tidjanibacter gallistercoris]